MVIDLTSSPIKTDLEHGSDNDLKKEDEVGFFCSLFALHRGCMCYSHLSNRWFSGSKLPTTGIKTVFIFLNFIYECFHKVMEPLICKKNTSFVTKTCIVSIRKGLMDFRSL